MTRFNELKRIEAAIQHNNVADLNWAVDYCKMRLNIATRKEHKKYWKGIAEKVNKALLNENPDSNE